MVTEWLDNSFCDTVLDSNLPKHCYLYNNGIALQYMLTGQVNGLYDEPPSPNVPTGPATFEAKTTLRKLGGATKMSGENVEECIESLMLMQRQAFQVDLEGGFPKFFRCIAIDAMAEEVTIKEFRGIWDGSDTCTYFLPSCPGVYIFWGSLFWQEKRGIVPLCIGQTRDLSKRFNQHHRIPALSLLAKHGFLIGFNYLASQGLINIPDINRLERNLITMLEPTLNDTPIVSDYRTSESSFAQIDLSLPAEVPIT